MAGGWGERGGGGEGEGVKKGDGGSAGDRDRLEVVQPVRKCLSFRCHPSPPIHHDRGEVGKS